MAQNKERVLKLTKQKLGGFGILIKQADDKSNFFISHIVKRGAADNLNGQLSIGDCIMSIKGIDVTSYSYDDVVALLADVEIGKSIEIGVKCAKEGTKRAVSTDDKRFNDANQQKIDSTLYSTNGETHSSGVPCDSDRNKHNGGSCPVTGNGVVSHNGNITNNEFSFVKLRNLVDGSQIVDTLHQKSTPTHCTRSRCMGSMLTPYGGDGPKARGRNELKPIEVVEEEAKNFIHEYYASQQRANTEAHRQRIDDVIKSIRKTGTYHIEEKELIFGAKTAWRNAPRCIGRIQWSKLQLLDYRHVTTTEEMFEAICSHLRYATNKGNIRSTITIFPPRTKIGHDFRVWNPLLIQYAGYRRDDGSILGDPNNVEFTEICEHLGWKPKRTEFDVLPLVLQANGNDPHLFEIPKEFVLEVEIKHPTYKELNSLGLRWYAVPCVSNMMIDVGGIEFPGAPFNGWYMATEISARNFSDVTRYNKLKDVAKLMKLDTSSTTTMWKDRAIVELTVAVMNSYKEAGVTIMDHHTAAETFMKHLQDEQRLRGGCPSDWVWIVPPVSGSATPVFHQEMLNYQLKPSYEYQDAPWKYYKFKSEKLRSAGPKKKYGFKKVAQVIKMSTRMMGNAMAKRYKATILYSSETGRSESYAKQLQLIFSHAFDPKVVCMKDYEVSELEHEHLVLIVTSTFGNGEAPENGEEFGQQLYQLRYPEAGKPKGNIHLQTSTEDTPASKSGLLSNVRFSVFGLGSRAYPHFCAFANSLNNLASGLGGECIYPIGEGDELCGQEETFRAWAKDVFKAACETFCVKSSSESGLESEESFSTAWAEGKFTFSENAKSMDPASIDIGKLHGGKTVLLETISVKNLQNEKSGRSTILVKLSKSDNQSMSYAPGDHLAVHPCNDGELVKKIIELTHDNPDNNQDIQISMRSAKRGEMKYKSFERLPANCTYERAMLSLLDITTPPTPQFLAQLKELATDTSEQLMIEKLSEGGIVYEDWKFEKYPTMLEVLKEFPSLKVPALFLLTQLPILKPRYYSISSSPLHSPNEIHITVAVVNYRTLGGMGPVHNGVCSTWLDNLQPGNKVPCFVRTAASFHMPENSSVPIVMVGPGTGIAPLRSFWQHRNEEMKRSLNVEHLTNGEKEEALQKKRGEFGPMKIYFGCRNSKLDNIYGDELQTYKDLGTLTEVNLAFSREEGTPKTYVQDLLKANGASLLEDLVYNCGHLYVCGDVSMASDVGRTLQSILEKDAAMSQSEAQKFIQNLKSEGRYHEDIFGITLRLTEVTDRVRNAARKAWVYLSTEKLGFKKCRSFDERSNVTRSPVITRSQTIEFA